MNNSPAQSKMLPLATAALMARRDSSASLSAISQMLLLVFGVLTLAVSANIKLPFYPVPLTLQTLVVMVIGMSYGMRLGGVTILSYLSVGALGAPVFAGGAGIVYLAGPTGGYLIGFLVAAIVLGYLAERGWSHSILTTALSMLLGTAIIYSIGLTWLAQLIGFQKAITVGFVPFIYGDTLKLIIASLGMPYAWSVIGKMIK